MSIPEFAADRLDGSPWWSPCGPDRGTSRDVSQSGALPTPNAAVAGLKRRLPGAWLSSAADSLEIVDSQDGDACQAEMQRREEREAIGQGRGVGEGAHVAQPLRARMLEHRDGLAGALHDRSAARGGRVGGVGSSSVVPVAHRHQVQALQQAVHAATCTVFHALGTDIRRDVQGRRAVPQIRERSQGVWRAPASGAASAGGEGAIPGPVAPPGMPFPAWIDPAR